MKKIIFAVTLVFNCLAFSKSLPDTFPAERKTAIALFDNYLQEVKRLDGDGLLPRSNRKTSWERITAGLRSELAASKSKMELGRVFARIDAAYTNLHAHLKLAPEYDFASEGRTILGVSFQPEKIREDGTVSKYLISNVRKEHFINLEPEQRPKSGDRLLALNHKTVKAWSDENFEFCKFPLRSQCEADFFDNFRKGMLSWHRRIPLVMTILRDGKKLDLKIPVYARVEKNQSNEKPQTPEPCDNNSTRYPGFKMVYQGYHACVYENSELPGTALLRIESFRYKKDEIVNEIDQVSEEAGRFAKKYWDKNAQKTKVLILDVVENYGGDVVYDWTAQFIGTPFQDQWVQFKKTPELETLEWRKEAFYDDKGKYKIYDALRTSSTWSAIAPGDFIPPMPQFCVSDEGDCLVEKFKSANSPFSGNVVIITDSWCISSCVGFVWTLKKYLKDRVVFIGLPDSGDSTYSRTYIEGWIAPDKKSHRISIYPRKPNSKAEVKNDAIFEAAISTSRSTDDNGNVISGVPMKMNYFDAINWDEDVDMWVGRIVKSIGEFKIGHNPGNLKSSL